MTPLQILRSTCGRRLSCGGDGDGWGGAGGAGFVGGGVDVCSYVGGGV